jgi:hypothetical protein
MTYQYKNGLRYRAVDQTKPNVGYHFHSDISARIGTDTVRALQIHIDSKVSAGVYIPLKVKLKKVNSIKLNNYKLTPKIDYLLKDNSGLAFTFNLTAKDRIEIEGFVDATI